MDRNQITCASCFHKCRHPMDPLNVRKSACLAHPPTPILRFEMTGQAVGGQAYPEVTDDSPSCGDYRNRVTGADLWHHVAQAS